MKRQVRYLFKSFIGFWFLAQGAENGYQADTSFSQDQALVRLRKEIAGRENEPAEKVFRNIQMMKDIPAARLLRVMELGYSKSLGVTCTHCHSAGAWEREDKPQKQVDPRDGGLGSHNQHRLS